MTGHSEAQNALYSVSWPDAELREILIDYDRVRLHVREGSGQLVEVIVMGYIGYGVTGFWDEVVIERVELERDHASISRCVASLRRRFGDGPSDSGSPARNAGEWFALLVHFIDGAVLEVVAASLNVIRIGGPDPGDLTQ
jgi:hypothetical protein